MANTTKSERILSLCVVSLGIYQAFLRGRGEGSGVPLPKKPYTQARKFMALMTFLFVVSLNFLKVVEVGLIKTRSQSLLRRI